MKPKSVSHQFSRLPARTLAGRLGLLMVAGILVMAGCAAPAAPASAPSPPAAAQPAAPAQAPTAESAAPQVLPAAGASPAATAPAAGNSGGSATIKIANFAFADATLTVAPGTTVEWENDDTAAHTVTADDGSFDSGNLAKGAQFKHTFTQEGTFAYYCRYHGGPGGQGMAGKIIVKK